MGWFSSATPEEKRNKLLFEEYSFKVLEALQKGADPNCTRLTAYSFYREGTEFSGKAEISPLQIAILRGSGKTVEILLAAGADPNFSNKGGMTCLLLACARGHAGMIQTLLDAGADPNKADADGWTPLHYITASGNMKIEEISTAAQALIAAGAVIDRRNSALQTPVDLAKRRNYTRQIASYLENKFPDMPAVQEKEHAWEKTGNDEIALVSQKVSIGYRLTEIFNFEKRTYIQISRNLETNAESQSMRTFEEFPDVSFLEFARKELLDRGGKPREIAARQHINKGIAP